MPSPDKPKPDDPLAPEEPDTPVPPDPLGPPIEEPPPTPENPEVPIRDPRVPGQPPGKYANGEPRSHENTKINLYS